MCCPPCSRGAAANGTNIVVSATGSPSPVYLWYDNNGNLLQAGPSQTLPLANLAHALQPYLSTGGNESRVGSPVGTAAVLGGIVGGLLDRDR